MVVRKFFATNTREALRLVREALGADALILANRAVTGGVEIMAVAEHEVASVAGASPTAPQPMPGATGPAASGVAADSPASAAPAQALLEEMRQLRGLVEGQLAGFAWREFNAASPVQAELMRELLTRGFGAGFARSVASRLPPGESLPTLGQDGARQQPALRAGGSGHRLTRRRVRPRRADRCG